jgi:hypothetical protein
MVLMYSATTSEMWESVAVNSFLEALDDPELALEVRKRGPNSLDAAYRDALLLEGYLKASVKSEAGKGRGHVRATTNVTTDVATELRRELRDMRRDFEQQEKKHTQVLEKLTQHYEQFEKQNSATSPASRPQYSTEKRVADLPTTVRTGTEAKPVIGVCFRCGKPGLLKRNCPEQHVAVAGVTSALTQNNRHIAGSRSAYLPATIFGRERWCLLDAGSEVSVVPSRCVSLKDLKPSVQVLNAANGTTIAVLGEIDTILELGSLQISVTCLVQNTLTRFC